MEERPKSEFVSRMERFADSNRQEIKETPGEKALIQIATERVDPSYNHASMSTIGNYQSIVSALATFLSRPNNQKMIRDAMKLVNKDSNIHFN